MKPGAVLMSKFVMIGKKANCRLIQFKLYWFLIFKYLGFSYERLNYVACHVKCIYI